MAIWLIAAAFSGSKEARTYRCRPLDEEADGLLLAEVQCPPRRQRPAVSGGTETLLLGEVEGDPARGEDAHARR